MRGLPIRRLASTAFCAALVLGVAGPSAMADDDDPARERGTTASRAPVPGADTLLDQSTTLAGLGTVLTPVSELLGAVAKADDGQLSADDAEELGEAVKEAITEVNGTSSVTPSAQTLPADVAPQTPSMPLLDLDLGLGLDLLGLDDDKAPAPDLKADTLGALQVAVDDLLAATTSGSATKVEPAARSVVTGAVNLMAATQLSGGLPQPTVQTPPAP
ncbi:hypothetical protein [Streptomyces sp. NPDC057877]|uniref:hypothetical protein n=1 Tax=Streptomyces sp. NPDC057877 TaxID=3346269 RepID=UPI0036842221